MSSDKGEIKNADGLEIIYQGPKSAETLQRERPRCVLEVRTHLSLISAFVFFEYTSNSWSLSVCMCSPVQLPPAHVPTHRGGQGEVGRSAAGMNNSLRNSLCQSADASARSCVNTSVCVRAAPTSPRPDSPTKCRRRWLRRWRDWTSAGEARTRRKVHSSSARLQKSSCVWVEREAR